MPTSPTSSRMTWNPLRIEVAGSIKDQRCSPPPLRSLFVHAKLGP
ncbi:MAG TPA: hypothetical protein VM219_02415 [Phycisphaerae bacterium]|nr:hypothetical protein [Phycisphaerae bacterium]